MDACRYGNIAVDNKGVLGSGERYFYTNTTKKECYPTINEETLLIIVDTGSSISITPDKDDFITAIRITDSTKLTGISNTIQVQGIALVEWRIIDAYRAKQKNIIKAYYVPDVTIRIFSTHKYFQEQRSRNLVVNSRETVWRC